MKEKKWYLRWEGQHPNATIQEKAEAINRHTLSTTIGAYILSTFSFVAIVYLSSLI